MKFIKELSDRGLNSETKSSFFHSTERVTTFFQKIMNTSMLLSTLVKSQGVSLRPCQTSMVESFCENS